MVEVRSCVVTRILEVVREQLQHFLFVGIRIPQISSKVNFRKSCDVVVDFHHFRALVLLHHVAAGMGVATANFVRRRIHISKVVRVGAVSGTFKLLLHGQLVPSVLYLVQELVFSSVFVIVFG